MCGAQHFALIFIFYCFSHFFQPWQIGKQRVLEGSKYETSLVFSWHTTPSECQTQFSTGQKSQHLDAELFIQVFWLYLYVC